MSRNAWIASIAVVLIIVGGFYWYANQPHGDAPPQPVLAPPEVIAPATTRAGEGDGTGVSHPLPATDAAVESALPPLGASDTHVRAALEGEFGKTPMEAFLIPDQLLRRFVVTVNSLDGDPIPLRQRPLRHVPGALIVAQSGDRIVLSTDNARRYTPMVSLLQSADPKRLVDLYVRYYPLLQRAYVELGYPDRYFNDRVIAVIDHLLETREVAGPIELVRPKVMYEFADRDLERRSFGEKILIRMGPENASIVRRQLRAFREELLTRSATR